MLRILKVIQEEASEFAKAPLFQFLQDRQIAPLQRLSFAPSIAHFVVSFGDMCRLVLFETPARDIYQELVNQHAGEDATHWRWFLSDLGKLGFDPTVPFSEALRFIWSDATVKTRMLTYHLCRLALGASPLRKLALIYVSEAVSNIATAHVVAVGNELAGKTGSTFEAFGEKHREAEDSHTLWTGETRRALEATELDRASSEELTQMVHEAFGYFRDFIDEAHAIARAGGRLPKS